MSAGAFSDTIDRLINLIYPRHCFICGDVAPFGDLICPECTAQLPYIHEKRCRKCSKPILRNETYCEDCQRKQHVYTEGFGLFLYNDLMREAMIGLKYKQRQEYALPMGELLYAGARDKLARWRVNAIVPIPIHKTRMRVRGYNQAERIARPLSKLSHIPLREDLLVRSAKTKAMKTLNPEERRENLMQAFSCPYRLPKSCRLLLVDDIYTTGATMDAAAAALKNAGCGEVFFLSVCIGGGFMLK